MQKLQSKSYEVLAEILIPSGVGKEERAVKGAAYHTLAYLHHLFRGKGVPSERIKIMRRGGGQEEGAWSVSTLTIEDAGNAVNRSDGFINNLEKRATKGLTVTDAHSLIREYAKAKELVLDALARGEEPVAEDRRERFRSASALFLNPGPLEELQQFLTRLQRVKHFQTIPQSEIGKIDTKTPPQRLVEIALPQVGGPRALEAGSPGHTLFRDNLWRLTIDRQSPVSRQVLGPRLHLAKDSFNQLRTPSSTYDVPVILAHGVMMEVAAITERPFKDILNEFFPVGRNETRQKIGTVPVLLPEASKPEPSLDRAAVRRYAELRHVSTDSVFQVSFDVAGDVLPEELSPFADEILGHFYDQPEVVDPRKNFDAARRMISRTDTKFVGALLLGQDFALANGGLEAVLEIYSGTPVAVVVEQQNIRAFLEEKYPQVLALSGIREAKTALEQRMKQVRGDAERKMIGIASIDELDFAALLKEEIKDVTVMTPSMMNQFRIFVGEAVVSLMSALEAEMQVAQSA